MVRTLLLCLMVVLLLALSPAAYAQASAGTCSISGVVTDPSGALMPAVEITVKNVDTGVPRVVKSNEAGRYEAVALQPGTYEITASRAGFANVVRKGLTLQVGEKAAIDLPMKVSATTETVVVQENTPLVETEKTDVSTVMNMNDVTNLPLNGRRWDALAMTAPGVSNDGGFGLLSFRGISGLYNNQMFDGMDNNQAFFSEAKGRTRLAYLISEEAIREVQVGASNFSAQYGRSAGGYVNAVTKSGTNQLHGSFFYLIRDDALNAANPTSAASLTALHMPTKPHDRRQQFGPTIGGPLKKDKLFYFFSYDQQKRAYPAVVVPGSQTFLTQAPGTAPGFANDLNFYKSLQGPQDRAGNQWLGLGRVDWNVSPANQISGTVNILRWDSPNSIQTAPTHSSHVSANGSDNVNAETVILRWTAVARPNLVSELRFQYGRDFEFEYPNAPGPYVSVTNGINFGGLYYLPRAAYPDEKRWQVSHNFNWLRGRHSVKFGYDITPVNDQLINLFNGPGQYSYSDLNSIASDCGNLAFPLPTCQAWAAAPTGIAGKHYSSYNQAFDLLGKGGGTQFNTLDMAYYIEDTIKPATNMTLNLGLRYELQTMPPITGNPDIPATNRINTDKNNFGPRVGFAWDPSRKQKTVIHAGVGSYYGRTQNSTLANLALNNGVRIKNYSFIPTTASSPVFPNVLPAPPQGAAAAKSDVVFASQDFANPVIYQMEASVEQQLFNDFTLGATYMGTRGQRMPVFRDTNLFPPSQTATYTTCKDPQAGSSTACSNVAQTFSVPFFSGARPNTNYGYMTVAESVVNTWYHGLVIQAKKRFSHGFQMQAAFTLSKAQDDDQSSTTFTTSNTPLNPFNLKQDYALSDFDQRRRFTMSAYWRLPFGGIGSKPLRAVLNGFQLSGVLTFADGHPYSGTTSGNPTPSGILGGLIGVGGSSRVPYMVRNNFTGPGFANLDARLAREIKLSERVRWQLIMEGFNVTNRYTITSIATTQYNVRGAVLFPNPAFQTVSATGTNIVRERNLQFGTRLTF